MQVIGFNFTKINAHKATDQKPSKENRKINSNVDFIEIDKENIPSLNIDALKVKFSFKVTYEPKYAEIEFNGVILLKGEEEKIKEIVKDWKKKKLSDDVRMPLFNVILGKCTLRALQLEEELNLPTHMPMPRVTKNNTN